MMLEAVLSNADHPEYGVATIPFPIPKEQYTIMGAALTKNAKKSVKLFV